MGHHHRLMEDRSTESDADYDGPAKEASEENNIRDNSCGILANNVMTFCLCPKIFPEAKLKSFG